MKFRSKLVSLFIDLQVYYFKLMRLFFWSWSLNLEPPDYLGECSTSVIPLVPDVFWVTFILR